MSKLTRHFGFSRIPESKSGPLTERGESLLVRSGEHISALICGWFYFRRLEQNHARPFAQIGKALRKRELQKHVPVAFVEPQQKNIGLHARFFARLFRHRKQCTSGYLWRKIICLHDGTPLVYHSF